MFSSLIWQSEVLAFNFVHKLQLQWPSTMRKGSPIHVLHSDIRSLLTALHIQYVLYSWLFVTLFLRLMFFFAVTEYHDIEIT